MTMHWVLRGLMLLALAWFIPVAASASELPPELVVRIERAAEEGQRSSAGPGPVSDPWLNAVVIEAVAQRPALAEAVLARAGAAHPAAEQALRREVAATFPGLVAGADDGGPAEIEPSALAVQPRAIPGVPAPFARPPEWPILPEEGGADGYADDDPLRPINSAFFYVNGTIDFLLFEPIARVYRFVMPDPAKPHIRQAFANLAMPVVFGNDLLQFEFERAGIALGRFAINSTLGLAGLFDVAAELGLPPHRADFGQTLHRWGVGHGIYLVLPLFGSTNLRDAVGFGVDGLMDPKAYLLEDFEYIALALGEGIVVREHLLDPTDFITDYAENHYEAVRAWSWQQRQRELIVSCPDPLVLGVCPAAP